MDITGNDLEQIIHEFIDFPVEDIGPLGNGHINTSLFINAGDSYVLQYSEKEDMSGAKTKVVQGAENTSGIFLRII